MRFKKPSIAGVSLIKGKLYFLVSIYYNGLQLEQLKKRALKDYFSQSGTHNMDLLFRSIFGYGESRMILTTLKQNNFILNGCHFAQ